MRNLIFLAFPERLTRTFSELDHGTRIGKVLLITNRFGIVELREPEIIRCLYNPFC